MLQLRENLPGEIDWINVLGGLAPDNDEAMPEQTREMVQAHWRKIQVTIGTRFNFTFWDKCEPRRDTYKACRAVIAAARQGAEEAMIEAIQKAYYLRAMNPSDPETLVELAGELGLGRGVFARELESAETEAELQRQLQLRRDLQVSSFPSLVLKHASACTRIRHDYGDHRIMLSQILDKEETIEKGARFI